MKILGKTYNELFDIAFGAQLSTDEIFVHSEEDEQPEAGAEKPKVLLPSELPNVGDEQWSTFVQRMIVTDKPGDVSKSNALGMFAIMPRRLADFGMVSNLGRKQENGRTIWVAVFTPPLTSSKFLKSPKIQYDTFSKSMKDYTQKISDGKIEKEPEMSLSGALAILHRAGPQGLESWKKGKRFDNTKEAHDRVEGVF